MRARLSAAVRLRPAAWAGPRRVWVCPVHRAWYSSASSSSPSSSSSPPSSSSSSSSSPSPSVASLLAWAPPAPVADVTVHGYVRSVRAMKKHAFVTLGDGSSLAPLQAVVPAAMAGGLSNGAAVRLRGAWTPSPGAGQSHELRVQAVAVLGPSDAQTFPLQKKHHSAAFLRSVPHLRARLPFQTTLLRVRAAAMAALARFFAARAFVQTHPPLLTSSDCEGGGAVFTAATEPPFFAEPKYLTVSTQLHLEALAQAVGPVWTLSPTFRAEASDTPRHLCEFYMLEAEVPFVDDLGAVMDLAEDAVRAVAAELHGTPLYEELLVRRTTTATTKSASSESESESSGPSSTSSTTTSSSSPSSPSSDREDPPTIAARWHGLLAPARWPRITYTDALARLAAAPAPFAHAPVWGAALQTEHERYLAEAVGGGAPVFVTHYPRAAKAFYMLEGDGDTAACFDLLVPGLCEVAGGSLREHRLPQLLAAMRARGMPTDEGDPGAGDPGAAALDWYVDLRRWGCPPHGGFGLGFDRLLCYLTGVRAIRDTVAFPRWHGRCDC